MGDISGVLGMRDSVECYDECVKGTCVRVSKGHRRAVSCISVRFVCKPLASDT